MGSRSFQAAVVLLWMSAMGWLVVSKVLPPLRVGEPPTYRAAIAEAGEVAGWELFWDEEPMGWAASKTVERPGGVMEVHSRVSLDLPLEEFAPPIVKLLAPKQAGRVDLDARNMLEINPLGRLSAIRSSITTSKIDSGIRMDGRIEDGTLKLRVYAGGAPYTFERNLPNTPVVSELSPQARLPDLHVGQSWTMPAFSPFRQLTSPLEIVQATVEREEVIPWHGRDVRTWLVVYRSDSGAGMAASVLPRGRMWVRHDGLVLQQEVYVFDRRLVFVRLPVQAAQKYADKLDPDWLSAEAVQERKGSALDD